MRTRMLLATIAVVAVAACSNSNDATPTTTAAPSTTRASTTTTTTTTTAQPTTTTTTTLPPTTTESPPSTGSEPTDEIQQVIDDHQAAWKAFNEALIEPTNDTAVDSARALVTDRTLETLNQFVARFRAENLQGRPNSDVPARADVYRDTVSIEDDTATMLVCEVDSSIVVEVGGAPDGTDAIVSDRIISRQLNTTMTRSATGWLLASRTVASEHEDQDHCEDS